MNLEENCLIRFMNISKKKEGIFANFKVKGVRGGALFTANISVDLAGAEVDFTDPLETIIEHCAKIAVREFQKAEFQYEGLACL